MSDFPDPADEASFHAPTEIRIVDRHDSFGDEHVLTGVDLRIRAGGAVAMVGGSGCGTTALLDGVRGRLSPGRGNVAVRDHHDPREPVRCVDEASFAEFAANASPIVRPCFELMPVPDNGPADRTERHPRGRRCAC
jgi:predicted ABC-type transport system involved in lysophospholipase L1 biosynthesis ATPase subunit